MPTQTGSIDLKALKQAGDDAAAALADSVEYIEGTQTAATGTWTGVTRETSLTVGKVIAYRLPYAGSGSASLNLTLAGGGTTGAKAVYLNTTRVTTHFGAGAVILMAYDGTNWRASSIPNSNTIGSYFGNVTVGANSIFPYSLVMKDGDNTWVALTTSSGTGTSKARYTGGLRIDGGVMYNANNATYATGATTGYQYTTQALNLQYSTNCGTTLVATKPVYLVGTMSNGLFYLDSTWWTQTEPTTENGKYYIYLGIAYSTSSIMLADKNPLMRFFDGKFQTEEEISIATAQSTADAANNRATAVYGTCSTAAGTATKAVTCANFALFNGAQVTVTFSTENTAAAPTLNVNGTGAKNIYFGGANASSSNRFLWGAGAVITFTYNGFVWIPVGYPCTYYGACGTAAGTVAKAATVSQIVICKGTDVVLSMTNANTAASPTLNVSATGALAIYAGGAALAADSELNWLAGNYSVFTFDGAKWLLGNNHITAGSITTGKLSGIEVDLHGNKSVSYYGTDGESGNWSIDTSVNIKDGVYGVKGTHDGKTTQYSTFGVAAKSTDPAERWTDDVPEPYAYAALELRGDNVSGKAGAGETGTEQTVTYTPKGVFEPDYIVLGESEDLSDESTFPDRNRLIFRAGANSSVLSSMEYEENFYVAQESGDWLKKYRHPMSWSYYVPWARSAMYPEAYSGRCTIVGADVIVHGNVCTVDIRLTAGAARAKGNSGYIYVKLDNQNDETVMQVPPLNGYACLNAYFEHSTSQYPLLAYVEKLSSRTFTSINIVTAHQALSSGDRIHITGSYIIDRFDAGILDW